MHLKKITKKVAVFSMAAVLGTVGVSGMGIIPIADTPQVTKAAVKNYNVTVKKGKSVKLSSVVSASVLAKTNLTPISNSNKLVVSYTTVGKTSKILDGKITGLTKGTATLSFAQKSKIISDKKGVVYYTVMVRVVM